MSGILTGVKPIKMATGGLVPSGGLPYGSPQGALGGYGGMGLGTGSGYAEGGDVDYKELAKGIGSFAGEMLDPRDPINALLYALYLFPPAGVAATAGKLAYAGGKGIKAARAAKKAKRLSKLAPELTGKKGYDLGHKGGLGAYLALEAQELFGDEDVEEDEEEVIENADGGLIERPVLYAAKGKAIKKVIKKVKDKKKKKAAEAKKKKADADKKKKADEKAKKDREEAEKKRAEEQKTADEKIRKEEFYKKYRVTPNTYFYTKVNSNKSKSPKSANGVLRVHETNISFFNVKGQFAKDLEAEGSKASVDFVLNDLRSTFGSNFDNYLIKAHVTGWGKNPYTIGAYSGAKPGKARLRRVLKESVGGRIFFAGEATALAWATVHGADRSGKRVVKDLLHDGL